MQKPQLLALLLASIITPMTLAQRTHPPTPPPTTTPTTAPTELDRDITARLAKLPPHPRLFITDAALKAKLTADPRMARVSAVILGEADRLLTMPPAERVMVGRRLLGTSRLVLRRINFLAYAYRATGNKKYADRTVAEMLAVAAFKDWNPSHFLDVGEMTAAMGIGYDGVYALLTPEDRATIRTAIIDKGLQLGIQPGMSWQKGGNNWNQVCHGGLTVGALAIAEDEPALARTVIANAVDGLPFAMKQYAPDGAYPEGPSYWGYGTMFNVLFLSAIESTLGTDFDLTASPGFEKTAQYFLHVNGPSGNWFNYCDSWNKSGFAPAVSQWWFAARAKDATLVYNEAAALDDALGLDDVMTRAKGERLLPQLVMWATPLPHGVVPPTTSYIGNGHSPVALFRSGWTKDATYLAFKAGSPGVSHGHMDVGSFAIDALGVRWAEDLGAQDYESLESIKVNLWDGKQDGQRWDIFRLGSLSHNILTVDGQKQLVAAHADWTRTGNNFAITDLTPVYANQLASLSRGAKLTETAIRIQDELTATDKPTTIRWAMLTKAESSPVPNHPDLLKLTRDGKTLTLRVTSSTGPITWKTYPAKGTQPYDVENPGSHMVGFEVNLNPGEKLTWAVDFLPGDLPNAAPLDANLTPLNAW